MDDPTEQLRDYIEDNYTLATEGVAKADVKFTTVDYNTTNSIREPHIVVQCAGFRRHQPEEPAGHEFTFIVQVSAFPGWRKQQTDVAAEYGRYWAIVNHLKALFDSFAKDDIAGWQWAIVESGANSGMVIDTIPQEFLFNLTVKAFITWSV
jgi:hypothetical protein